MNISKKWIKKWLKSEKLENVWILSPKIKTKETLLFSGTLSLNLEFYPAIIARSFSEQVKHEGVKNLVTFSHILVPASFTPDELPNITEPVPQDSPADKTKVRKWLAAGGGVNFGDGIMQPLGIECEALILDFDRLKALFKSEFDKIINPPVKEESRPYKPELIDLLDLDIDLYTVR